MTKSSVYGIGRNRKHRAKHKSPFHAAAGSINMKGKKHKTMNCGCCDCIDFREKEMKRIHENEMKNIDGIF